MDEFYNILAFSGIYGTNYAGDGWLSSKDDVLNLSRAQPWKAMIAGEYKDVQPVVYFVSLRAWRSLFGDSEFALRSLSASCSVVALIGLFLSARSSFGQAVALWSCAIMSVAVWIVAPYDLDIRPFTGRMGPIARFPTASSARFTK